MSCRVAPGTISWMAATAWTRRTSGTRLRRHGRSCELPGPGHRRRSGIGPDQLDRGCHRRRTSTTPSRARRARTCSLVSMAMTFSPVPVAQTRSGASAGDDTLDGGAGDDTLVGGRHRPASRRRGYGHLRRRRRPGHLDLSAASRGLNFDLGATDPMHSFGGGLGAGLLISIEGSLAARDDVLRGRWPGQQPLGRRRRGPHLRPGRQRRAGRWCGRRYARRRQRQRPAGRRRRKRHPHRRRRHRYLRRRRRKRRHSRRWRDRIPTI